MKQYIFRWLILSTSFLVILSSCKKDGLTKMKRGKYEMINIRTFPDGNKDTIHCMVYGPRFLERHYYFSPEAENTEIDKIDVGVNNRRMFAGGPFPKRVESLSIRFNSGNFPLPGYFGGPVSSYDLQESKLVIHYSSSNTPYGVAPEEKYTGTVELNWVEL